MLLLVAQVQDLAALEPGSIRICMQQERSKIGAWARDPQVRSEVHNGIVHVRKHLCYKLFGMAHSLLLLDSLCSCPFHAIHGDEDRENETQAIQKQGKESSHIYLHRSDTALKHNKEESTHASNSLEEAENTVKSYV